jgi:hypothetical protein
MFMVIILVSRWIVRRLPEFSSLLSRLAVGFTALALMLGSEVLLARLLQGISVREYIASRDSVLGTIYFALLVVFAILPAYWSSHARHS